VHGVVRPKVSPASVTCTTLIISDPVVSAGWQLTINAFSPAELLFDIAERKQ
jgi:hypothetical protein